MSQINHLALAMFGYVEALIINDFLVCPQSKAEKRACRHTKAFTLQAVGACGTLWEKEVHTRVHVHVLTHLRRPQKTGGNEVR